MIQTIPNSWAKLDKYNYDLFNPTPDYYRIWIPVGSPEDVTIADISTMITSNDGHIYLEGHYLVFEKIDVKKQDEDNWGILITAHKFRKGE